MRATGRLKLPGRRIDVMRTPTGLTDILGYCVMQRWLDGALVRKPDAGNQPTHERQLFCVAKEDDGLKNFLSVLVACAASAFGMATIMQGANEAERGVAGMTWFTILFAPFWLGIAVAGTVAATRLDDRWVRLIAFTIIATVWIAPVVLSVGLIEGWIAPRDLGIRI